MYWEKLESFLNAHVVCLSFPHRLTHKTYKHDDWRLSSVLDSLLEVFLCLDALLRLSSVLMLYQDFPLSWCLVAGSLDFFISSSSRSIIHSSVDRRWFASQNYSKSKANQSKDLELLEFPAVAVILWDFVIIFIFLLSSNIKFGLSISVLFFIKFFANFSSAKIFLANFFVR